MEEERISKRSKRLPRHPTLVEDNPGANQEIADSQATWARHYRMMMAAREAFTDADWRPETTGQRTRTGVSVGMGMVDLEYIGESYMSVKTGVGRKVSPYFVPRILPNLVAGHISIDHGLMGPNHSCSTACATGAHSIGDAIFICRQRNG